MYSSVSEVVREALRLLSERDSMQEMKREALKKDIAQGINSLNNGEGKSLDIENIKAKGRQVMASKNAHNAWVVISPEAHQDLLDIWLYIAEDSTISTDRFLDKLHEKAINLSEFTEMGIDWPELAKELRSFPVDRYVLYYRPVIAGIELVRVLHGSRESQSLF